MSDLLNSASLVMIPSGYKEDVVYSQIPTDGSGDLSFTRASNGTRVNSAGLVEVVPWNLLEYSEQLDAGVWGKEAGNSVTANTETAPNGVISADTLTATAGNNMNTYQLYTTLEGVYTYSVYLKKKSTNVIKPYIYQTALGFKALGEINFDNGTFTTSGGTASIENVGNGWYRVSLTASLVAVAHTFGFFTTSTTGTRDVYIWGAQVNIGSTAKPYFPTTDRLNVPRLTYQNGGGGCPSLLLEKQSTNLALYSEDFTNGAYIQSVPSGTLTISANYSTSPDGTQNADRLQYSGGSQYTQLYQLLTHSTNVVSIYVKSNTSSSQTFRLWGNDFAQVSSNLTATTSWQRFDFAVTGSGTKGVGFCTDSSGNALDISIWGFQFEASSYATSYIPTTSSSATRVADECYKTGISSLIGQTEGTMFWEGKVNGLSPNTELLPISIFPSGGGTGGTQAYVSFLPTGAIRFIYYDGAIQCNISTSTSFYSFGTTYKIAAAYKQNDFAFYINGVQIGTRNTGNVSAMADLYLDYQGGANLGANTTNQVILFPTRLTNTELASLTTI